MLARLAATVRLIVLLEATQAQAAKPILVELLVCLEQAAITLGAPRRGAVDVGPHHPCGAVAGARRTGGEVNLPAGTGTIGWVEAAKRLGHSALERIAEVGQAVQRVER